MIGVMAKLKVKDGQGDAFEAVAKLLVEAVNANEPGNLMYRLYKAEEPNTYIFMERYQDEAALEAHRKSPHYGEHGKAMGAYLDGRPEVSIMPEVA
ncbi:putative quinol monooxygenase [Marinibaculum pumilum]|uniref:Quinol monooxygenase n=1 Tax=Marinibaculum pumilum TaxID=1766165 RepID=A0ABV7L3P2_9PROT